MGIASSQATDLLAYVDYLMGVRPISTAWLSSADSILKDFFYFFFKTFHFSFILLTNLILVDLPIVIELVHVFSRRVAKSLRGEGIL